MASVRRLKFGQHVVGSDKDHENGQWGQRSVAANKTSRHGAMLTAKKTHVFAGWNFYKLWSEVMKIMCDEDADMNWDN